ncbi:MAG: hypothetical protein KC652_27685 [Cyanobacteria bacterium HKST-UBA01]|nr:hypothetical protein [Cyanobacteria bacterium HKST-UBA01]
MNNKSYKKVFNWKDRVLINLLTLLVMFLSFLFAGDQIPWQLQLIIAIYITSSFQTLFSIGFDFQRPTFKRFVAHLPIYISHVYLPLLLCVAVSDKAEGSTMYLANLLFMPIFFELFPYFYLQLFSRLQVLITKHKVLLAKIAVPIALIFFFSFYGLSAVGNPQISLYIAFLVPFMSYAYLIFRDCMHKHSACLKTLPECLLKVLVLMVVPWLVLSSQTEFTYEVRLLIGLEFFAIGLINHTICPRIIGRIGKKHDNSS